MAPQVGNTVFVTEVDNLTDETTVSPAVVTHVFGKDDGPADWWKVAADREIVQAQVFRRNGTTDSVTVGKIDDENPTGYSSSFDGNATDPVEPAPNAQPPVPDTVNDGSGSGDNATTDTAPQ